MPWMKLMIEAKARKNRRTLATALFWLFLSVPRAESAQGDVSRQVEKGNAALEAGNLEKATRLFERASSMDEKSLGALLGLAQARRCRLQHRVSWELAKAALPLATTPVKRAEALTLMGAAFIELPWDAFEASGAKERQKEDKRYLEAAEQYLREALSVSHNQFDTAEYFLGLVLLARGEIENGKGLLRKYVERGGTAFASNAERELSRISQVRRWEAEHTGLFSGSTEDATKPKRVSGRIPSYTKVALVNGVVGTVEIWAVINRDGELNGVTPLDELPAGLSQAAVDAVRRWKFKPATFNDDPVAVAYFLVIHFLLRRSDLDITRPRPRRSEGFFGSRARSEQAAGSTPVAVIEEMIVTATQPGGQKPSGLRGHPCVLVR